MTIFLYAIFFIMGTLLGSFCTLAVYRIPLKKDIIHEQSFCPNCNHKLVFFDLIPIISYLALKGKCRYCGEKIRIRYLLLEIFSGIAVLLYAISFHFSLEKMEASKYVSFFFGLLYIVTLTLIAGIDKERKEISKPVLLFGFAAMIGYILYLWIVEKANIYRYTIYLFVALILLCVDIWYKKTRKKSNRTISILLLLLLFSFYTSVEAILITVMITLLVIAVALIKKKQNLPIGFYLCVSNLIAFLCQNFFYFF